MRKWAILGLLVLIGISVLVTMAFWNIMDIRNIIYDRIQGTVGVPIHDFIVTNWINIGNLGFTYIAATILGIGIGGGLFMVFIAYGLFWKKGIQEHILHKTTPTTTTVKGFTAQTSPAVPEVAPTIYKTVEPIIPEEEKKAESPT